MAPHAPALSPAEAACRCAEAFAARVLPGGAARFTWSGAGLVVEHPRGGRALAEAPVSWWPPIGPGLAVERPPLVAALGAVAVLLAAVLEVVDEPTNVVGSIDPLLDGIEQSSNDDWLGYEPVADGWVGIAAPRGHNRELLDYLRSRGELAVLPPVRAAVYLQSMGIAALPARGVSRYSASTAASVGGRPLLVGAGLPLVGHRVLDLGRVIAGPFAAAILSSLGAEARAVRPPGLGGAFGGGDEMDLRSEAGCRGLLELIAGVDLVVENFRPRAWCQLDNGRIASASPPRLALRGFPATSPCRNWKVYGFLTEAAFGVGPGPVGEDRIGVPAGSVPLWDRVTAVVGAAGAVRLLSRGGDTLEVAQVGLATDTVAATGW